MQTNQQSPSSNLVVSAAKASLRRNAALKRDHAARASEKKRKIINLIGSEDIATIAAKDPDRARKVAAEIAIIQSEAAVDELIVGGLDEQVAELGVVVIRDTDRLIGEACKLAHSNFETVRDRVVAQLRSLRLFEEARLPRLASEAQPLRIEGAACQRCESLGVGVLRACHDGKGGTYYEDMNAVSICAAHDAATAALAEVTARAKVLA